MSIITCASSSSSTSLPDWTRLEIDGATLYDPNSLIDSSSESSTETLITLTASAKHELQASGFDGAQYYLQVPGVTWRDALIIETLLHVITDPGIASDVEAGIVVCDNPGSTSLHWAGHGIRWSSGYSSNISLAGGHALIDVSAGLPSSITHSRGSIQPTYDSSYLDPRIASVGCTGYYLDSESRPLGMKTHSVRNAIGNGVMDDANNVYVALTIGAHAALTSRTVGLRAWYRIYEPAGGHDE